jgi:hypothetical protein
MLVVCPAALGFSTKPVFPKEFTGTMDVNTKSDYHICQEIPNTHTCYPDGPQDQSDWHVIGYKQSVAFNYLNLKQTSYGTYEVISGHASGTGSEKDSWYYYNFQTHKGEVCDFSATQTIGPDVTGTMTAVPITGYPVYSDIQVPVRTTYSSFSGQCNRYNKPNPTSATYPYHYGFTSKWDRGAGAVEIDQTNGYDYHNGAYSTTTTKGNLDGPLYKLALYSHDLHGFVQLTAPGAQPRTFGKWFSDNSFFGNQKLEGDAFLFGVLTAVQGFMRDDGDQAWDWRIVFPITKAQYKAALTYVLDPHNYSVYNLIDGNCVDFAEGAARAAGLGLPDFTDRNAPLLGPTNQFIGVKDGRGVSAALSAIGDGGVFGLGVASSTNGSLAGRSPDPPAPPSAAGPATLAAQALDNPAATARQFSFKLTTASLGVVSAGHTATIRETPSGNQDGDVVGIDWGDGSKPEFIWQPTQSGPSVISLTHRYSKAGTYTDHLVLVEDGRLVTEQGRFTVGSGSAAQSLKVPGPGPLVDYPTGVIATGGNAFAVTTQTTPTNPQVGHPLNIVVQVKPGAKGRTVWLQGWLNNRWQKAGTKRLGSTSRTTFNLSVAKARYYRAVLIGKTVALDTFSSLVILRP